MKPRTLVASIIVSGLAAAGPVFGTGTVFLPAEKMQGGVSYITGGVGEDEAAAFKQAAATFPLEMLFVQKARPMDEYLADVRVSVRDRSGISILETTADGPFLLARLPAGKYQIDAEYLGERKRQSVDIRAGKHSRAVFVWANREEPEPLVLNNVK